MRSQIIYLSTSDLDLYSGEVELIHGCLNSSELSFVYFFSSLIKWHLQAQKGKKDGGRVLPVAEFFMCSPVLLIVLIPYAIQIIKKSNLEYGSLFLWIFLALSLPFSTYIFTSKIKTTSVNLH